jgi:hypothetical protein
MSNNGTEMSSYGGPFLFMQNTFFKVSPGRQSIASDGFGTVQSFGYNLSSDDGGGYLTLYGRSDQHRGFIPRRVSARHRLDRNFNRQAVIREG